MKRLQDRGTSAVVSAIADRLGTPESAHPMIGLSGAPATRFREYRASAPRGHWRRRMGSYDDDDGFGANWI